MALITPEAKSLMDAVLAQAVDSITGARQTAMSRALQDEGADRYNSLKDAASFKVFLNQLRNLQTTWLKEDGKTFMPEVIRMTTQAQDALAVFDDSVAKAGAASESLKEALE